MRPIWRSRESDRGSTWAHRSPNVRIKLTSIAKLRLHVHAWLHNNHDVYLGGRLLLKLHRLAQRRSTHPDIWLYFLLAWHLLRRRFTSRDGFLRPYCWWPIPLGVHACAQELLQFPELAHRLDRHPWMECQHCCWRLLWRHHDPRSIGS